MNIKKRMGGFTIVELLVVIVVIAILVALTLPNLFGLQRRARDDTRKNDLKNIQQALETFFNDNSAYPDALADLNPDYYTGTTTDPENVAYTYTVSPAGCTTACTSYTLSATLENDNDSSAVNGVYTINSVNQ